MNDKVTIKDIAYELNLSVNTVSRALRNMSDISQETKLRVLKKADEMKYTKNQLASTLRTQKSHMIGAIMPDILNPVYSGMYKGVEKICKDNGYTILLANTNESVYEEKKAINTIINHQADGIILCPSMENNSNMDALKRCGTPFVLIGRTFHDPEIYSVVNNDRRGGYLACEHLLSKGFRSFIYLSGPLYISSAIGRKDGFCDCMRENGLDPSELLTLETEPTWMGAYRAMEALLDTGVNKRAIFTFNDIMAMGVLKLFQEHGIAVPEQVAVIGYDDIDLCSLVTPGLSTIDICKYRLGVQGMTLLMNMITKEKIPDDEKQMSFEPKVVAREST